MVEQNSNTVEQDDLPDDLPQWLEYELKDHRYVTIFRAGPGMVVIASNDRFPEQLSRIELEYAMNLSVNDPEPFKLRILGHERLLRPKQERTPESGGGPK